MLCCDDRGSSRGLGAGAAAAELDIVPTKQSKNILPGFD